MNPSTIRALRALALALVGSLAATAAPAHAQDADLEGRTLEHAATLVSAIAELAERDVGGAICADSRHRRASVLVFALAGRERRLRAAVARRDASATREERAVISGLLDSIRALHAEAATCVGASLPPAASEPRFESVVEVSPDAPRDAVRPSRADAPRSAVSE